MRNANRVIAELHLNDVLPPKTASLRELIVDSVITADAGSKTFSPEVLGQLCAAHSQALQEDGLENGKTYLFLFGQEAKDRYHKVGTLAYCENNPEDGDWLHHSPAWPSILPMNVPLSLNLIDYMATILGYRSAKNVMLLEDYCKRHPETVA